MRRTIPTFAVTCTAALALLLGSPIATATAISPSESVDSTDITDSPSGVDAIQAGVEIKGTMGPVGGADPTSSPSRAGTNAIPSGSLFWVLQMNLCNGGGAGCYEGGRAVPEAQDRILSTAPDLVTLNEICRNDITPLYSTFRSVWGSYDATFWAFLPAVSGSTGNPVKCQNGQDYGIGLIGRMYTQSSDPLLASYGYRYGPQDSGNEKRVALCSKVHLNYWGCTTHLTNNSGTIALQQCNQLMKDILPSLRSTYGYLPSAMGGDLNLFYNGSPNVQNCVPSGWYRKGDGARQHIMLMNAFTFNGSNKYATEYTDHPHWLVRATYSP